MNRIYLVTGASGHLGTAVVNELVNRGERLRVFLLEGDYFDTHLPETIERVYGNLTDPVGLKKLFENISTDTLITFIHIAGIVTISSSHEQLVYDVNVGGTKNVIALCKKYCVDKLIYVSSVHAITEKPKGEIMTEIKDFEPDKVVGLYAKTKAAATRAVLEAADNGLNASVVHPSGIIGPYDYCNGHTSQLIRDYCSGNLVAGVDGGYDFVDVRDVANGLLECAIKGRRGECYILSNRYCTVREILELLHEITGKKRIKTMLPWWFARLSAPIAELYYKLIKQTPLYTSYSMYTLKSNAMFSHKKADEELGYKTRDIKTTLLDTYEWLIKNDMLKTDRSRKRNSTHLLNKTA